MKSAGRLAQQAAYTRSVCIAHASFFLRAQEEGPPTFDFIEKSREFTRFVASDTEGGPVFQAFFKHPLTYFFTAEDSETALIQVYAHARPIITIDVGNYVPSSAIQNFQDRVDPSNSFPHFLGFAFFSPPDFNTMVAPVDPIHISVFDCLNPEKYYFVAPEPPIGSKAIKAPSLPKLAEIFRSLKTP